MSQFESHGNGFSGRVDGPIFDARHILMPGAMVFGTMGEAMQADAQRMQANGQALPHMTDVVGKAYEAIATMPLDAKAVGVGLGVAAATQLVQGARAMRDIKIENGLIGAGISPESAVESARIRAIRRIGSWAIAGVVGTAAYKGAEHLSAETALLASMGAMGAGTAYLMGMQKRLTGRFFGGNR